MNKKEESSKKINYNKRNWLKNKMNSIIFHSICNIIILLILIVFISTQTSKIIIVSGITKEIYIGLIYLGVTSISILGAYLSVKIEEKIRYKKKLKQIKEKIVNQNNTKEQINKGELNILNDNKKLNNETITVINRSEEIINKKTYTRIRKRKNIKY